MENLIAIFAFFIVGAIFSYLSFNFIFIKIYEKDEKRRIAVCSIASGYLVSCFLMLFMKYTGLNIDKTKNVNIDFLIILSNYCKGIDTIAIIVTLILCVLALYYEFFFKNKKIVVSFEVKSKVATTDEPGVRQIKINSGKTLKSYESDLIPYIDVWVGRQQEVELIESIKRGVTVITGFGGQGKSSLAAKCVRDLMKKNKELFWDWRDCKEESDRFRTQLVSVISNFTDGQYRIDTFSDASVADISKAFFKLINGSSGIIVFDNVDQYVNINENLFASDISCFINEALRVDHGFLILFTCRPRVSYPSPRFREIYLRGFSIDESKMLFEQKVPGGLRNGLEEKVAKFHEFTDGHPLWLDIIASQVARKAESAEIILREMEAGQMDERAKSMLRSVWKSLNEDQKNVLRCMSEVNRSVGEEIIYNFIKEEIANFSRFSRVFRNLKAINLIVERTDVDSTARKYDLHPMVRGFIRDEYKNSAERKRYITMVLRHYDDLLVITRQTTKSLSVAILEDLSTKVELEIEKGDIESAIDTIDYTSDDFIERGLHEEYIRLSKKVFNSTDWDASTWKEEEKFLNLCGLLIKTMTEVGKSEESLALLEIYTSKVPQGTARYISVCDLNCYVNWFLHDYAKAIDWGKKGSDLKKSSGIDTKYDTSQNLALSLRDNNQVDDALKIFLQGLNIEDILIENHKISKRGAAFYGNIGRCLARKRQHTKALKLYAMSYDLLEKESGSTTQLNKGYASSWISEELYELSQYQESYAFALRARMIWESRAPLLTRQPEQTIATIKNINSFTEPQYSGPALEVYCTDLVSQYLE
jgi:tetratricopeptide (TPR) repeat protein